MTLSLFSRVKLLRCSLKTNKVLVESVLHCIVKLNVYKVAKFNVDGVGNAIENCCGD
jgi:hypothetical protein